MSEEKKLTLHCEYTIAPYHSAESVGSGDMPILSTPSLIAFMENAAMKLAREVTEEGYTTVGTKISSDHQHATPLGETINVVAELVAQEGRKLTFRLIASDSTGVVAEAMHERFIVYRGRFLERLGISE